MAINFSSYLYRPCQDYFSVPITVHPMFSQPDGASYEARGIYDTRQLDVMAEDGSIFSDQQSIIDLRTAEFEVLPQQKDRISIPFDCNGAPLGEFEVVDTMLNGGGELTCVIRKLNPQPVIGMRREER